jgi:hypothetical protein
MMASLQPGTYTGIWRMRAPNGMIFGINVFVRIVVAGEPVTPDPSSGTPFPTQPPNCVNDAAFVEDLNIPDDTLIAPGATFIKTWRMRNSGSCHWTNGYALVLVGGHGMGTSGVIPVPATAAGSEVDISVSMMAPRQPGTYISTWKMTTPQGVLFGTEPYLRIIVSDSTGGIVTPTPGEQLPEYPLPSYISGITYRSREIYVQGQRIGNRATVFSKIGDSITDERWFLYPIGERRAVLYEYSSLQGVIDRYLGVTARTSNSFDNESIAATGGWDSFDLLDPANSAPYSFCGNVSPLECELRTVRPAVALILIGGNDAQDHLDNGSYESNLRKMVSTCIDLGVIPVLYTLPWNIFRDVRPYNEAVKWVAADYQIPVIDYWVLMERLPNHGLRDDGAHPSYPPDGNSADFSQSNLGQYGYNVRNLITLQLLDALWKMVMF